jgi:hypothetical protein
MAYKYNEPPKRTYDVLEEGDYQVTVIECGEPYESKTGKDVVAVKLEVKPSKTHVYYRPWTGKTKDGDFRDNISEFLKAVNRAPKVGQEPNWKGVVGAQGKCRIKQGEYNGDTINEIGWFYVPRDTKTATTGQNKADIGKQQSISADEFQKLREQQQASGQADPDNIPY